MEQEKYRNPIWQDKNNRHIVCEILQGNGEYAVCHVVAGPESEGGQNADYDALIEIYGLEGLDEKTQKHKEWKIRQADRRKEHEEQKHQRGKQEVLFNMKLEAFEIEAIKNSQRKDLKKLIRKAKTPLEVTAYTTILLQREMDSNE